MKAYIIHENDEWTTPLKENLQNIRASIPQHVTLVAVSKTKPIEDLLEAYHAQQRVFGENKAQEMKEKYDALPKDIEWHFHVFVAIHWCAEVEILNVEAHVAGPFGANGAVP